jgi:PAS domain S-box-containing protein
MKTAGKLLLLVEDESIIALSETQKLKAEGYQVIHVLSGEAAVDKVEASVADGKGKPIDLVLMDIDLGKGMDGTEAARRILEISDIPVVFLSAHTEPEIVERTEQITNYGYILKNTGHTVLSAAIKMAFKLHEAYRELQKKEKALGKTEEMYSKAFINSPFAVVITRVSDNVYLDVNEAFTRMTGWSREEAIGRSSFELNIWVEPGDYEELASRLRATGSLRNDEIRHRRKDGSSFRGLATYDYIEIDGERCVLTMFEDITSRLALDKDLAESEAHYRVLLNDLSNAVAEEDFSRVRDFIQALKARGVSDFRGWFTEHPGDVLDCAKLIRIVRHNQEFLRINATDEKSLQEANLSRYITEGSVPIFREELIALAEGKSPIDLTFPNSIPSVRAKYLRLRLSIVSGHEEDWSSVLVSFTDLTREIEAGERMAELIKQKDALMRELEHRVKNNLNIVSSMLSLESAQAEGERERKALLDAQSRIRSISLIYDLLSRSAASDCLDMRSYLEELVLLLSETYSTAQRGVRLDMDLEDFRIDVKRGVSIGLIVTELVTNSFKYAFTPGAFPPGSGKGVLSVTTRLEGGSILLSIGDNGPGIPAEDMPRHTKSLGFQIISMLTSQMKGHVEIKRDRGFIAEIAIPLEPPRSGAEKDGRVGT